MKIICVGRNYADHVKELNNEIPEDPVIFLKPDTAKIHDGDTFYIPSFTNDVHYEAELVVRISKVGKHIQPKFAHKYYDQISVGIDFTARDIQQKLKEKGLPWEKAKAFDGSAAVGKMINFREMNWDVQDLAFHLNVNGQARQKGHTGQMMRSVDELIAYISTFITLKVGDLIYTGTPAGVGKVEPGDEISVFLQDVVLLNVIVK